MSDQNEQPTTGKFNPQFWQDEIEKVQYEYDESIAIDNNRATELLADIAGALDQLVADEGEEVGNSDFLQTFIDIRDWASSRDGTLFAATEALDAISILASHAIDIVENSTSPREHVWVTVYDDVDGKTFDQYTVAITREGQPTEWYGMSYNANWPNGFNQCIEQIGDEFLATQKIIPSWDWPDGLTAGIKQRIES